MSLAPSPPVAPPRRLTAYQWKAGAAAWLGWMFDGLDMHLYTLVAGPFVAALLGSAVVDAPGVKEKSAFIQGAFLVGWAVGGSVFGRLGDTLGRSRTLGLSILCYAAFTGLSAIAGSWEQLLVFRFLAALGIGGEWAVGSSLLAETWPSRWRAWAAAALQTGVNVGVLLACLIVRLLAGRERMVFLVGVLPALMVFWIRRSVPEPPAWESARARAESAGEGAGREPGVADLFRPPLRRTTLLAIGVCSLTLTAWWAFMFWFPQQLSGLPELRSWSSAARERLVSASFFAVIGLSIAGNFFAAALARLVGYRRAIALLCLGFAFALAAIYRVPRGYVALIWLTPWVGFCSGVFALFTMYLPPLFPTLLRSTGAGVTYNIGRIAAAVGTVAFGLYASRSQGAGLLGSDALRRVLAFDGLLFLPAMVLAWMLPDLRDAEPTSPQAPEVALAGSSPLGAGMGSR